MVWNSAARVSYSADGELSLWLIYTCICVLGMREETEGRTVSWMSWPICRSCPSGWHGCPIERQKSQENCRI